MIVRSLIGVLFLNFVLFFCAKGQQDFPANFTAISSIPASHIYIINKADTTILLNFFNPDTGLPGSMAVTGKAIQNKDKSYTFKISSILFSQSYKYYDNSPNEQLNVISLYGSKKETNACRMKMTALYQGNKTYVLEMQSVDSLSYLWKVKLHDGAIDSVWNNCESLDSSFRNWTTKISNVQLTTEKGARCYSLTLDVRRDFVPVMDLHLLDTSATGRIRLSLSNVYLTAPTSEPDWKLDITAKSKLTINLAQCISTVPKLVYTYKDTVLNYVLNGKITSYINDMSFMTTEKYVDSVYAQNFIIGLIPPAVQHDSTWLDVHGTQRDSMWIIYPQFIAYQANKKNYLNKDTSFHPANSKINIKYINNLSFQYIKSFWYDLAASQYARTDYEHRYDISIAPTFKMDKHIDSNDAYQTQWTFRYRYDSTRMKYVLNGGYIYKVIDSSHYDPTGNFIRLLKDDHPGEFIIDSAYEGWRFEDDYWQYKTYDYLAGTTNDTTDNDYFHMKVSNDTTVTLSYNDLPKMQLAACPYSTSQPFHSVILIEPGNNDTLTDPVTLKFVWNSAPQGFKFRIKMSIGDNEFKNPELDSLIQDTTAVLSSPNVTPGSNITCYWEVLAMDQNGDGHQSEIRTFTVKATHPKGVSETNNNIENVFIYPNPVYEFLKINSSNLVGGEISIYDMLGNKLISVIADSPETHINIEPLSFGVYLLKTGDRTLLFVKKKE